MPSAATHCPAVVEDRFKRMTHNLDLVKQASAKGEALDDLEDLLEDIKRGNIDEVARLQAGVCALQEEKVRALQKKKVRTERVLREATARLHAAEEEKVRAEEELQEVAAQLHAAEKQLKIN